MRLGEAEPQLTWEMVFPELGRKARVLLGVEQVPGVGLRRWAW